MPESNLFSQSEKNYFTELKLDDIEASKTNWANCTKYCNMNRTLYRWTKDWGGNVFFNKNLLTENLNPLDFG